MKEYKFILLAMVVLLISACNKDDDKESIVVHTADLKTEIKLDNVKGDTLGVVPGSSNIGTVSFNIESQLPKGIFKLGESGELIVLADSSVLSKLHAGSKVLLKVSVNSGEVSEISRIEVKIIGPPEPDPVADPGGDPTPWIGDLYVTNEWGDTTLVTGTQLDSVTLELGGPDPLALWCNNEYTVSLKFGALTTDTKGPVTIENHTFPCWDLETETLEGIGVYETDVKIITLTYTYDDGEFPFSNTLIIGIVEE